MNNSINNSINPEPSPSRYGAHFVRVFGTKDEALAYRKHLSKERRQGAISSGVRHKTTARRIKVDGAVVTVYCVTERRTERWHCIECDGTSVQLVAWIEANTNKVLDGYGSTTGKYGHTWCEHCDDNTRLVLRQGRP